MESAPSDATIGTPVGVHAPYVPSRDAISYDRRGSRLVLAQCPHLELGSRASTRGVAKRTRIDAAEPFEYSGVVYGPVTNLALTG